ncbi:hypothetical protein JTE90_006134 [Oedothorax gibbosus]|uniref:Uncharacterized protein n=1 Tax=Oedothorax gibbosus TaxID=931172 RepID=A0AAV6V4K8_9ARAC|nr:hypothetical protein JTE90_006134 [Oedothorax gibbosus]
MKDGVSRWSFQKDGSVDSCFWCFRCERRLESVRGAVLAHVAAAEEGARTLQGAGRDEGAARAALRSMLRALGGRNLDDLLDQVARMQLAKVAPDCAEAGRRLWSALRTELMEAVSSAGERVSLVCRGASPLLRRAAAAALGATACATSSTKL